MAQDKENFLARWSRVKQEQEKKLPEKTDDSPAPALPPVDTLTPESDFSGFMRHPRPTLGGMRSLVRQVVEPGRIRIHGRYPAEEP